MAIVLDLNRTAMTMAEVADLVESYRADNPDRDVWLDGDRMQILSRPHVTRRAIEAAVSQPEASWKSLRNLGEYVMGRMSAHDSKLVADALLTERARRGLDTYVEQRLRCFD